MIILPQLDAFGSGTLAQLLLRFQRCRGIIRRRKKQYSFNYAAVADEVAAIFEIAKLHLGCLARLHAYNGAAGAFENAAGRWVLDHRG
jgi:hypothetical protein